MVAHHHFNKKTLSRLHKKGIFIIGLTSIPDMNSDMPWANSSIGYEISDNGTSKIRTASELIKIANSK